MVSLFLKAKHWQLFILMFGVPIMAQFIFMGSILVNLSTTNPPDPKVMLDYFNYFPLLMILFVGVFFGWFWSLTIGLQRKIPFELQKGLTRFKVFFFIPLVYIIVISFLVGSILKPVEEPTGPGGLGWAVVIISVILPLHLLSMFSIFHTLYYTAKTIKIAELQRKVTFSDFIGEFFLLWFYLVGVWIIQPKVNEISESAEIYFID